MKNANEIIKVNEQGDITQEWLDYVHALEREDLETFFIGADLLLGRVRKYVQTKIDNWYANATADEDAYKAVLEDQHVLAIILGKEKEVIEGYQDEEANQKDSM